MSRPLRPSRRPACFAAATALALGACSAVLGIDGNYQLGQGGESSGSGGSGGGDAGSAAGGSTTTSSATGGGAGALPLGETCSSGEQCASGTCVDDFCCDGACEGLCESCGLVGHLGECFPVPAALNPDGDCDAASLQSCDGNGECKGLDGADCDADGDCISDDCNVNAHSCVGP